MAGQTRGQTEPLTFHALRLNENLDPLNPTLNSCFAQAERAFLQQTRVQAAAHQMALQSLENLRGQQASALSYFDAFLIFTALAIGLAFMVLLMKRSAAQKGQLSKSTVQSHGVRVGRWAKEWACKVAAE